ncbi:MAG TPA: hypothetical protein VFM46_12135, partial [Pseudomonadales bacterium]|nr:hypothetical protein [Pseudomonadales bacterium]
GMKNFGDNYVSPWFMSSDDTDVMCGMGEGMSAMTFPLGPKIDPMIPMVTLASGMCADERSKEEELRSIRALRKGDVETSQDARTMQKRWANVAAKRQLFGYQAVVRYFGEPGEKCPEFADINEKQSYMFGMLGGIQAFQLDLANGGTAGVPLDILPKATQALSCLDSKELWGIPDAVLAAQGLAKATLGGDKNDIAVYEAKLSNAAAIGEAKGVRLVQMLEAAVYFSLGDEDKTKQIIRDHVKAKKEMPADPNLKLLDEMATRGILLISDKIWTKHTGQRTPYGQLGTFWDDVAKPSTSLDIDNLL